MKEQCVWEWRTGEACGAKLSLDTLISRSNNRCKICEVIATKKRHIKKEEENPTRWGREPLKFVASIEKSKSTKVSLAETVAELEQKRQIIAFRREPD
jgi:hypothetical protein